MGYPNEDEGPDEVPLLAIDPDWENGPKKPEHTPLPWHLGIVLYPYVHFYGPTDAIGFSPAIGSCQTALGEDHDVANAAFIVRSVNAIPDLISALEQIRRYSDENLGPSRSSLLSKIAAIADAAIAKVKP